MYSQKIAKSNIFLEFFCELASGLQPGDTVDFLDVLASLVEPTEIHYLWHPQLRDAEDDMVLEAAINAMADAIVTFNTKDFGNVPLRFGIQLLLPRDALARIRAADL